MVCLCAYVCSCSTFDRNMIFYDYSIGCKTFLRKLHLLQLYNTLIDYKRMIKWIIFVFLKYNLFNKFKREREEKGKLCELSVWKWEPEKSSHKINCMCDPIVRDHRKFDLFSSLHSWNWHESWNCIGVEIVNCENFSEIIFSLKIAHELGISDRNAKNDDDIFFGCCSCVHLIHLNKCVCVCYTTLNIQSYCYYVKKKVYT